MLSHINKKGNAQIVDISSKGRTKRSAVAIGSIFTSKEIFEQILINNNKKGDILTVAKIAGIQAAKKTSSLIPLCHQINLDDVNIDFLLKKDSHEISARCEVKCHEKTGAEMEALTSISITLLTIYDMCKALNKKMIIGNIQLEKKIGGKSDFKNDLK